MPTASDELRKEWHSKRVWVKIGKDVDRKSLGVPVIFGRAWMPLGDTAAERYLKSRGYREHRFMWYAPKLEVHRMENWRPTRKEGTALAYLCDEWDHSYDLRRYPIILKNERDRLAKQVVENKNAETEAQIKLALQFYGELVRVLA